MKIASKKMVVIDLVIAFVLVLVDQFTKHLAVLNLMNKPSIVLIPGVLELHYLENRGAAFGALQGGKIFFVIMTVVALAFMAYVIVKMPAGKKYTPFHIMSGVLIAGALGNFIDRLRLDYVVDFIYFSLIDFPIFNVADMYLTVTCVLLMILILFGKYEETDFVFFSRKKKKDTAVLVKEQEEEQES